MLVGNRTLRTRPDNVLEIVNVLVKMFVIKLIKYSLLTQQRSSYF